MKRAYFLGCNALGDTLCTTPVIRAFRKRNPECFITYIVQNATYCRVLDGNPDIDLVLYNEYLWIHGTENLPSGWVHSLPLGLDEPSLLYFLDMRQVSARPESFRQHISKGFSNLLGIPTDTVRPVLRVTGEERRTAGAFVRRPYAVISMHSNANPRLGDGTGAKDWPQASWRRLADHLQDDFGLDVIAIGSENDIPRPWPSVRNLYGLPIKVAAALLENAQCVITLENGLAHLAAAVDAPLVEIYSKVMPLEWAFPAEASACDVIYEDPRRVPIERVLDGIERVTAAANVSFRRCAPDLSRSEIY